MKTVILLMCLASFALGASLFSQTVVQENHAIRLLPPETFHADIRVPAVDEDGTGVTSDVSVNIEPGYGRTLASIENVLFFTDTQSSIRIARDVAQRLTGFDLANHDLIYTVRANASVIEGPSAGAALTIATIAALEEKEVNQNVMITGTIQPDGRIGKVGEVSKKAIAARSSGATIFLIPKNSGPLEVGGEEYERTVGCRMLDGTEYCETRYVKKDNTPSLTIVEVGSVQEALPYFLEE